jgi:hypothetical protein
MRATATIERLDLVVERLAASSRAWRLNDELAQIDELVG